MTNKLAINDRLAIQDDSEALARKIAMDIGKDVAFHIESMYPEAVAATSSTMLLSVRNYVYNQIMNLKADKHGKSVPQWIAEREHHRKVIRKLKKSSGGEQVG